MRTALTALIAFFPTSGKVITIFLICCHDLDFLVYIHPRFDDGTVRVLADDVLCFDSGCSWFDGLSQG